MGADGAATPVTGLPGLVMCSFTPMQVGLCLRVQSSFRHQAQQRLQHGRRGLGWRLLEGLLMLLLCCLLQAGQLGITAGQAAAQVGNSPELRLVAARLAACLSPGLALPRPCMHMPSTAVHHAFCHCATQCQA